MSDLFLGVDLGTSGLKTAVVHADGVVVGEAEAAYTVARPAPGYAEIDPQVWEAALTVALAQLGDLRFDAVGIAGQMHGLVLVDANGLPCRPAMLWPDRRAEGELAAWRALQPDQRLRLANPFVAGMAGPMLKWVQDNEPQVLASATAAMQPKDYVRSRLGGPIVAERSDASATLLWDVPGDGWAFDIVEDLRLPGELLPEIVTSSHIVGQAQLPGAPALVAGAGDTPAALLGSGGLGPGEVQINLGTGAQILIGMQSPEPVADPATHLYADAGHAWYGMVAIQNAGLALNKVRQWLGLPWEAFFALAGSAPTGAGGVSVVPFLAGERGGVATPSSRGAWLGLSDATTPSHLARAAIEGMIFTVRRGLELLTRTPTTVRASGGGVREQLVAQMLADVLGAVVHVIPDRSASALGAAMLAAAGVGQLLPTASAEPAAYVPQQSPDVQASYLRWLDRLSAADL
jgi:xylulokinase